MLAKCQRNVRTFVCIQQEQASWEKEINDARTTTTARAFVHSKSCKLIPHPSAEIMTICNLIHITCNILPNKMFVQWVLCVLCAVLNFDVAELL